MILQTQIPLNPQENNAITYHSKLLLLGSCFSENIGNKFSYFKFQSFQNPFGVLFQPKAIEKLIAYAVNQKEYMAQDIFLYNERWHSLDTHSKLSVPSKEVFLNKINTIIKDTHLQLKKASHVIITLGTAWVYRFKENNSIVANCHKIPQKKFTKEILSINQVSESIETIIALLKSINPEICVIYTVSPIRHLKDGFIENQQSKSYLISAIHNLVDKNSNIYYFPSYEIMMDELRDYRFYNEDMIHPNSTAINYIWEKFIYVWISQKTHKIMKEVEAIQKGLAHKPFNSASTQHQYFLKKLILKQDMLKNKFPFMNF